jgi:hypothetical protein
VSKLRSVPADVVSKFSLTYCGRYKFYLALDNSLCDECEASAACFIAKLCFQRSLLPRYISEKVVRALSVGAVPVMWSRVAGWERIIPGPLAAVFVEDFGFDALRLVRALEAEALDERLYLRVSSRCIWRV